MKRILTLVFSVLISFSTFVFVGCKTENKVSAEKNIKQDGDTLVLKKDVIHKDSRFTPPSKPAHCSHSSHCSHHSHVSHFSRLN